MKRNKHNNNMKKPPNKEIRIAAKNAFLMKINKMPMEQK